jgi:AraC-like DNA-binding protein
VSDSDAQALNDTLALRVSRYIDTSLADPALGPEQIAAAHSISVRQLYRVWRMSGHDLPLTEWILHRRLEHARAQLTDLGPGTTIAAIARGNGFATASHFARRFRQAYTTTPGEWRRLSRDGR